MELSGHNVSIDKQNDFRLTLVTVLLLKRILTKSAALAGSTAKLHL